MIVIVARARRFFSSLRSITVDTHSHERNKEQVFRRQDAVLSSPPSDVEGPETGSDEAGRVRGGAGEGEAEDKS